MYVCLCQGITDKDIRDAINSGCSSYKEVRAALNIASQCGKCGCLAKQITKETMVEAQLSSSAVVHFNPAEINNY
ncbi:(2Fe-2S)-binding protein [Gammaproteobacteria bacterium ESL0073]|nr:(2Fe-2S)-binding protein [Gammaproteobacteria bacterium ESL0073]